MRYVVLFPASRDAEEGTSWRIVEADDEVNAATYAGGRSIAPDDKALIVPLATDPTPVYANVGWTL